MSEMYEPSSYRGFRFDDPFFKIKWPHQPNLISEKDATFPPFLEEDDD
jgi:dTDP-4-dehydrorhamnose 3,5-epimerase